ncbi:trypsin-like peptidase domain-containing protein [Streptomyces albus]|uniref:nSTAND1 domain-containing NTPase n=1 Tax=Streptomyces albus TaxID=1888 RepID=UPI0004C4C9FE|nr:trypsin-like peptidase domain-containing protein [Streptomyces albus]
MTGAEPQGPDEALASSVVRIKGPNGEPVGAGFLLAPDVVLTCAHVVAYASGEEDGTAEVAPGTRVTLDMPLDADLSGRSWTAEVEHCVEERGDSTGDVAVLRVRGAVPGGRPLALAEPATAWDKRVGIVGFTGPRPGGSWYWGVLGGPTEEGWRQLSRTDETRPHIEEGFSGSPVWDSRGRTVVGLVAQSQRGSGETQQTFVIRASTVLRLIPELERIVEPPSPFRSLQTFREGDADVYFGRDDDTAKVTGALLAGRPSVTVYGPSGSGKSSLALAGVVPRMREKGYDILVVDAGPVSSPLAALATELYEAHRTRRHGARHAGEVQEWLTELGLVDTLHRLRGRSGGKLLVVLDQAEALLAGTDTEVAQVVDVLFPESRPAGAPGILVTLRADFVDAALRHPSLGPALHRGDTLPLTPMSREQLTDVITKPLDHLPGVAVTYEPGLVQRILDDAGSEAGTLPLLGFVLEKLWEGREGGRLRTATYEEAGGVSGALAAHAAQAWDECVTDEEKQKDGEASRLLTGLVRVLPGSPHPLRRRLTRQEAGDKRWAIAIRLADAERRLLVLHGGRGEPESVELAHEALVTAWPALQEQVRSDSEFLAARWELAHEHKRWTDGDKAAGLLPTGLQLALLERHVGNREKELDAEERNFLELARQRHRTRRNRLRAAWIALAVVIAVIAGLGTFLVHQGKVSERRDAEARSRAMAVLAGQLDRSDPGQAALVAMAAYEIAPTQEARNAVLRGYDRFKRADWVLSGAEGKIVDTAMSTDGTVTLVTTQLGRASLFVRGAGKTVTSTRLRLQEMAFRPMVSRDGRRIAYTSGAGALVWHAIDPEADSPAGLLGRAHTIRDGEFRARAEEQGYRSDQVHTADFSPDARRVVTVAADGRLRLWDLETGRHEELPSRLPAFEAVWFGPDGDTLVAQRRDAGKSSGAHTFVAVNTGTGRMRELATGVDTFSPASGVYSAPAASLSGDGGVLAWCRKERGKDGYSNAVHRFVRVRDGRVLNRYRSDSYGCGGVSLNESGHRFAVHSGEWVLGDLRRGGEEKKAAGAKPANFGNRLLGDADRPVVTTWDETTVTGLSLRPVSGREFNMVASHPLLIDDGRVQVAQVTRTRGASGLTAEKLVLYDVVTDEVTTEVERPTADAPTDPDPAHALAVNEAETLVADVVGRNRILIRRLPSLREVAEITTLKPPVRRDGKPEPLSLFFAGENELVTLSGSRIERWDTREGRRLSDPVDARDLGLAKENPPLYSSREKPLDSGFAVNRRPEPGYVQIMVRGDSTLHAVDLRTGKEDKALRVSLGPDNDRALLDSSGRYAAAKTKGALLELWSVRPGEARRVVGPLGPLGANDVSWGDGFRFGFTGHGTEFFVANGNSVRFQRADDPSHFDSYDFAEDQHFVAASRDGRTLVRAVEGRGDLIRLDPGLWKRHLCDVVGRDLTRDERRGMPGGLPDRICS